MRNKINIEIDSHKGEKLLIGIIGSPGVAVGIVNNDERLSYDSSIRIKSSEIVVLEYRSDCWTNFKNAGAFVTDLGGAKTCSPAIIARELRIPAIVGTEKATRILKSGQKVIVDANEGVVYSYKE
jgi:phosphohistidine swiveling domain-containing protein